MKDLFGMMSKLGEVQAKAKQVQDELEQTLVEGAAGGGAVQIVMSAKGELKSLKIDPSLLKPEEAEIVEDLIVAAHADARAKAEAATREKMESMTSGLPIPPGMLKGLMG